MSKIQSIRGMNDILPNQIPVWQKIENVIGKVFSSYGYQEIRFPIIEKTELFNRAIGEVTDIVEKEMYTFLDRNGDSLSLRPEGTASCVRACEQNGLLYNQTQKLWYQGPMFRHERPQKGRLRQFHQIGVEAFGFTGVDVELEMILMMSRIWKQLGISNHVQLQINSLGTASSRGAYKFALVSFLEKYIDDIDEDSVRRLYKNPLRILDSKDDKTKEILMRAPRLEDYLEEHSINHFKSIVGFLEQCGVDYEHNHTLVRGLDYYNDTVFEWVTHNLGAQGTICAGGRYDVLVQQLGGRPTAAFGLAMGMERTALLMELSGTAPDHNSADIYVIVEEEYICHAMVMIEVCRNFLPDIVIHVNTGGGSLKNQFKRADRSGAQIAIVYGESEFSAGEVTVKMLRLEGVQYKIRQERLLDFLGSHIFNKSGGL